MRWLLLTLVVGAVPGALQGQGEYRRTAGDTLRYREVTDDTTRITLPQGVIPIVSSHDAVIALTFLGADSARAWYQSLALSAITPQGRVAPTTMTLLGKPYRLQVSPLGAVRLVSAPAMPPEVAQLTDLTRQFDDYLVRLPGGPLARNRSWTDSTSRGATTDGGAKVSIRQQGEYRVVGDTVTDACTCILVASRVRLSISSSGPGPSLQAVTTTDVSGVETGIFLWDPARGRMVSRRRAAQLTGTFRVTGVPQPIEAPVQRRYHTRMELVTP